MHVLLIYSLHLSLFYYFVCFVILLASDSMKVLRQWVLCDRNSSYDFIPVFFKRRCACGMDMIFKLIVVTFSTLLTLSFFTSDFMNVYRQWVPFERNFP